MYSTTDFRKGLKIEIDGTPFEIIEFQHFKPGKGGAMVRTKLRNILNGRVLDNTFRSGQNRDTCMRMLRSKLVELQMQAHAEKISDIKGVQLKIEWGSQIRSYVFMPYQLVKDNRTGYETSNINAVMDGELDGFINAYLKAEATGNWAEK